MDLARLHAQPPSPDQPRWGSIQLRWLRRDLRERSRHVWNREPLQQRLELGKLCISRWTRGRLRRVALSLDEVPANIADNLSKAGWSWGCVSAVDSGGRTIWIADAHRGDGNWLAMRADEKLTAFLEPEAAVRRCDFRIDTLLAFLPNCGL